MRRITTFVMMLLVASALFAEMTGYDIVKKSDEVPAPNSSSVTATLTIHSKKGSEKVRQVIMKSKEYDDVTKEVIVFTSPKDVAGVGYLMFEYKEDASGSSKDSDNWLYMPAMKKTRRIASSGSEGEGSFMGTDFTYEDLGSRSIDKDTYELLGEEWVDGILCYKVKCTSIAHTEKDPERIAYIGKEDYILRRCEFYDRTGQLHRVLNCSSIKEVSGYAATTTMKMENLQTGTWSLIEMSDIVYDGDQIDDGIFTVAALERGNIR